MPPKTLINNVIIIVDELKNIKNIVVVKFCTREL